VTRKSNAFADRAFALIGAAPDLIDWRSIADTIREAQSSG
jgi:hypothetical protein